MLRQCDSLRQPSASPCRFVLLMLLPNSSAGPGAAAGRLPSGTSPPALCPSGDPRLHCPTAPQPQGLESLLGGARGGSFDLSGNIWDRKVRLGLQGCACRGVPDNSQLAGSGGSTCGLTTMGPELHPPAQFGAARNRRLGRDGHGAEEAAGVSYTLCSVTRCKPAPQDRPPPPLLQGWAEMDKMREKLEDLKELRDLVRSLGRCVPSFLPGCGAELASGGRAEL